MIKVFTLKNCPYCKTLKERLKYDGIEYKEFDADEYEDLFEKISEKTGNDSVPVVLVNKQILAPEVSFNNIDQAMKIIHKLISDQEND